MKLLVVDDSSTMRRIIISALKALGYNDILEAKDGAIAWDILLANPDIEILLTDWNMPVLNGYDLVSRIRSKEAFDDLAIIMITTEKTEVIKALKIGVNNYILKPFTPQILQEKLEYVLG